MDTGCLPPTFAPSLRPLPQPGIQPLASCLLSGRAEECGWIFRSRAAADGMNPCCQSIVMLKNAPRHTQRCLSQVQNEWETLTEFLIGVIHMCKCVAVTLYSFENHPLRPVRSLSTAAFTISQTLNFRVNVLHDISLCFLEQKLYFISYLPTMSKCTDFRYSILRSIFFHLSNSGLQFRGPEAGNTPEQGQFRVTSLPNPTCLWTQTWGEHPTQTGPRQDSNPGPFRCDMTVLTTTPHWPLVTSSGFTFNLAALIHRCTPTPCNHLWGWFQVHQSTEQTPNLTHRWCFKPRGSETSFLSLLLF